MSDLLPRNFASRAFQLEIPTDIPRLERVELRNLRKKDDAESTEVSQVEFLEQSIMVAQYMLAELREAEFKLIEAENLSDAAEDEGDNT